MIALSIRQPWAWLIVNGHKDIENRDWPTSFRGTCLVHAGKKVEKDDYEAVKDSFPHIPMPPLAEMETGGIVGQVDIVGCIQPGSDSTSPWYNGGFGFQLANSKPLPFQPVRGQLLFFNIPWPVAKEGGA